MPHKFTPQYEQAALKLEHYQFIVDNNINGIIASLKAGNYQHQGSVAWQIALSHSTVLPGKGPIWHGLDLFVIHALSGLSPSSPLHAQIIAHLKTSDGRRSMEETVATCLEKDITYADKIIALGQDPHSLFYQGIYPQRINIFSRESSTAFKYIMTMCFDAKEQYERFLSYKRK